MSDMTLLIFGKAVTLIAAGGVLLYILERSATRTRATAESRSDRAEDAASVRKVA